MDRLPPAAPGPSNLELCWYKNRCRSLWLTFLTYRSYHHTRRLEHTLALPFAPKL